MKRRFVVAIGGETQQDVDKIVNYAREKNCAWHHWINNFWLFTSSDESITTLTIRDDLNRLLNAQRLIVLQVEAVTWSTLGPNSKEEGGKNMSRWIRQTWDRD